MCDYSISTFRRYIYINIYAFLIILMGIGIIFLPLSGISPYLIYVQILLALICLKAAISILEKWNSKKRRYKKLIEANTDCFNPDSFKEYMQAPCGRLLVKVVLDDLGKKEQYNKLKKTRISWIRTIKSNFKVTKTVIYKKEI